LKQDCNLKTLEYLKEKDLWQIQSAEFVGDSRLEAHRRRLTYEIRQHLVFEILDRLERRLGIQYLDSMKHFYIGT